MPGTFRSGSISPQAAGAQLNQEWDCAERGTVLIGGKTNVVLRFGYYRRPRFRGILITQPYPPAGRATTRCAQDVLTFRNSFGAANCLVYVKENAPSVSHCHRVGSSQPTLPYPVGTTSGVELYRLCLLLRKSIPVDESRELTE